MSSVTSTTCPSRVLQYLPFATKWAKQTGVPVAFILAIIDQESDGNVKATRAEPAYHSRLMQQKASKEQLMRMSAATGLKTLDIVTSYGLMQPLFSLAYGYGARRIEDLYDPDKNIRYCSAHLGTLWKKHKGNMRQVAGDYNGAGETSVYASDVVSLYKKYDAYLKKGV